MMAVRSLPARPPTRSEPANRGRSWTRVEREQQSRSSTCRARLPADRGSGRVRGGANVPLVAELAHVGPVRVAVGDVASVVEGVEIERPDIHDFLEPVEFLVGETNMPAVGVNGRIDELGIAPADAHQ